jgi:glycosyltransferase involved in cell wall biosynthesis
MTEFGYTMKPIKISVAVTTYKRPKMIDDLIKSYLAQSYKNSELVIVDDCVEDKETQSVVQRYQAIDTRIRFIKNNNNLGFCKNFLKSLVQCKGEYIVTLGDDDILLDMDALGRYVDVFEKYSHVSFVYSGILQFNQDYRMDFAYRNFEKDILFKSLEDTLRFIWLKSCYIPGIGLRNDVNFEALYPDRDWLFPQVELIGKMLAKTQAYGISDFLIGGRAHNDQLGFEAVKGRRIKKTERHSSLELPEIFDTLKTYYRQQGIFLNLKSDFINRFFEESHASILPTEKINTGNANLIRVFLMATRVNKGLLFNPRYLFYMSVSFILPSRILLAFKNWYKERLVKKYWSWERKYFEERIRDIGLLA